MVVPLRAESLAGGDQWRQPAPGAVQEFGEPARVGLAVLPGLAIDAQVTAAGGRLRLTPVTGPPDAVLLDIDLAHITGARQLGPTRVAVDVDGTRLVIELPGGSSHGAARRLTAALARPSGPGRPAWAARAARPVRRISAEIARPFLRGAPRAGGRDGPVEGIFLSHVDSDRVRAHFTRLVAETESLVQWHFVLNRDNTPRPTSDLRVPNPERVLAGRYRQMQAHGGLLGGFLDVVLVPCLLGLNARHVWVCEYDVDYSGHWADLFSQFASNEADLLTSTLAPRSEVPDWGHWPGARAPAGVPERHMHRAFHPLMRVSHRLALTYALVVADTRWRGHFEFTLPTVALTAGAVVEDLGGEGRFTPANRLRRNYLNTPGDLELRPGTFTWRPARGRYFGEDPSAFDQPGKLYHPVKPAVIEWDTLK